MTKLVAQIVCRTIFFLNKHKKYIICATSLNLILIIHNIIITESVVKSGLDSDEEEKFKPHAFNILCVIMQSIQNVDVLSTAKWLLSVCMVSIHKTYNCQ